MKLHLGILFALWMLCGLWGAETAGGRLHAQSRASKRYGIQTDYDADKGCYRLIYTLYGRPIGRPLVLSPTQYLRYLRGEPIGLPDSTENISPRAIIPDNHTTFSSGMLRLNVNGYAELSAGRRSNNTQSPTFQEQYRQHSYFDVEQDIRLSINGTLGRRLIFGLDYNTEAAYRQDARRFKLSYRGLEDEIIRSIEFGRVGLLSRNSLVGGTDGLIGFSGLMRMGRLQINWVAGRSETQTRRSTAIHGRSCITFEITADRYDERRHFFLAHFFRNRFDRSMRSLPNLGSGYHIDRIEVWVTNKQGQYEEARNIVAVDNLGMEADIPPDNTLGGVYAELEALPDIRQMNNVDALLQPRYTLHHSYERIENARKLSEEEYTLHPTLGYLSLHRRLDPDEVLAVAYRYTHQGQTYQVGEFASERKGGAEDNLILALLKPSEMAAEDLTYRLMMRNIYSIGSGNTLQPGNLDLNILARPDSTGIYLPYFNLSNGEQQPILRLLQADRLNERGEALPDGQFDYLEGYTVNSRLGTIILPTVEPFRSGVREALGKHATPYIFDALYDSTHTVAQQQPERNRFLLRGSYVGAGGGSPSGGSVRTGSVSVRAGGMMLAEGIDYEVDYATGAVRIINEELRASGIPVDIQYEDQEADPIRRRTLMGFDLNYAITPEWNIGASWMHLRETPTLTKMALGEEAMRNTMWGVNVNWRRSSKRLTEWLDALPWVKASEPSYISFDAELARLHPGHYWGGNRSNSYGYIDDFENARGYEDLLNAHTWYLSATPWCISQADAWVTEAKQSNQTNYGAHRALLSWYHIDPVFTQNPNGRMPTYLAANADLRSNHYSRAVEMRELFPGRDFSLTALNYLHTLNLSYYPGERGPYNLNSDELAPDGSLINPERNWGGIMRALHHTDFEEANIEYIEFWLLDPFIYQPQSQGGELRLQLGNLSEDILRDGRKFHENGLTNAEDAEETVWGRVPRHAVVGRGFDLSGTSIGRQDVGLNGLTSEEEKNFSTYADYLNRLRSKVSSEQIYRWSQAPLSPFTDPAGDNFVHCRSEIYDRMQMPITERYKYYNGTEGNSTPTAESPVAATSLPDGEDINQDNTLSDQEQFYEYAIALNPKNMHSGSRYVADSRTAQVLLPNGRTEAVTWYLYRIPIREYTGRLGNLSNFRSLRFMRLCLTGFNHPVHLRFGSFRLVRGTWRPYTIPLQNENTTPSVPAKFTVGTVNLEENSNRRPVNYVLPPDAVQSTDAVHGGSIRTNEQSLSITIQCLAPQDAVAIYREGSYDLRRYRRLQLHTHAESADNLQQGDLEVFVRLGTDYRQNFYEYSQPLTFTPPGLYSSALIADREAVWPYANLLNIPLNQLPILKAKRDATGNAHRLFSQTDEEHRNATLSVMGHPTLSDVRTLMIGVRNRSGEVCRAEVWVNELRTDGYDESGGWAAHANMDIKLSDIGSIHADGAHYSAGFGAIDQRLHEREWEDRRRMDISTQWELGRLLPERFKLSAPLYVTWHTERTLPHYNPLEPDLLLNQSPVKQRDLSTAVAGTGSQSTGFSLTGVRVGITGKKPMPYDPANFSWSYSHHTHREVSSEVQQDHQSDRRAALYYDFRPERNPWLPFGHLSSPAHTLSNYQVRLLPEIIHLGTDIRRFYQERQLRNLQIPTTQGSATMQQYLHRFLWNREMHVRWQVTSDLRLEWQSGTNAIVHEPYRTKHRDYEPDGYRIWRDSVMQSLRRGGSPMQYRQNLSVTYTLPTAFFTATQWIQGSGTYRAYYQWERGAYTPADQTTLGNRLTQTRNIDTHLTLDVLTFYRRKVSFANLFRRMDGTNEKISPTDRLRYLALMLRRIQINYSNTRQTYLTGFLPEIAPLGGQAHDGNGFAPGIPFALGLTDAHFIRTAVRRGWLNTQTERIAPATYAHTGTLDVHVTLHPLPHLDISLQMHHTHTRRTEVQYMSAGIPHIEGGFLSMSTVGLRSFFRHGRMDEAYRTPAWQNFLEAQGIIAQRLTAMTEGAVYPSAPFLQGTAWIGSPIQHQDAAFSTHNPEVLAAAFRSAYIRGQGDSQHINFNALSGLRSMLPNWTVTYTGLSAWHCLSPYFSRIELTHSYRGVYTVGNYTSHRDWTAIDGSPLGIAPDAAHRPVITLKHHIPSIALQEHFYPLIGLEVTLRQGLTLSAQRRMSRGLVLHTATARLIESYSDEWAVIAGYRWSHLPQFNWAAFMGMADADRKAQSGNGGLYLRMEYSQAATQTLLRNPVTSQSRATAGNRHRHIRLTADYDLSEHITLRAFYDRTDNRPLVTDQSFPVTDSHYGISLRLKFL